jgi:flagellar basal body-associated protein FliL
MAKKKKSNATLPIVIAVLVIVLLVGGLALYFGVFNQPAVVEPPTVEQPADPATDPDTSSTFTSTSTVTIDPSALEGTEGTEGTEGETPAEEAPAE